jgi:AcrR family transcriptional regulator
MADQKRPYTKKRRAELEEETRLRITESAMELHGTVGPSRTSVSAVAERAGVRRSTVYRHFPDEAALFTACSTHWAKLNPPPDIGEWAAIEDPDERLRAALEEIYAYYERTEQMMENLIRDEELNATVKQMFGGYRAFLTAAREVLMAGRGVRGRKRARMEAASGHALTFPTWRSLVREQGLTSAEATELMCRLLSSQV